MRLLVIDNYDSFTYNLVHLFREVGVDEITVKRNDRAELAEIERFDHIVISPGPGVPMEAGLTPQVVSRFGPTKRILGVCLGHQCIGEVYGATLVNMPVPVHGRGTVTRVTKGDEPLFRGLPPTFITGRYHSWLVDKRGLPAQLVVTAEDDGGSIMALRHVDYDVCGVQFHPESVLTENGRQMIVNWLEAGR